MINAENFVFDGIGLDQKGLMICSFDNSGGLEVSPGSNIEIQTIRNRYGREDCIGVTMGDVLKFSVQVCKRPDVVKLDALNNAQPQYIDDVQYRNIVKWLQGSRGFRKLTFAQGNLLPNESQNIHFDAVVERIDRLKLRNNIIGLEIYFRTSQAYGYGDVVSTTIQASAEHVALQYLGGTDFVTFEDDYFTDIKPDLHIEVRKDGDFSMKNLTNDTTFTVPDCVAGEILDYKGKRGICVSSIRGVVTGDGSFSKFRLSRSPNEQYDYRKGNNEIKIYTPSYVTISYTPTIVFARL
jgi:hypothetical protein